MKPWRREIGGYNDCIALIFDRHLGSVAAEMAVKFQSNWESRNKNREASRLHQICGKPSIRLVNRSPEGCKNIRPVPNRTKKNRTLYGVDNERNTHGQHVNYVGLMASWHAKSFQISGPVCGEFICHEMERLSLLLALCDENPLIIRGFPYKGPVMGSINVLLVVGRRTKRVGSMI